MYMDIIHSRYILDTSIPGEMNLHYKKYTQDILHQIIKLSC